MRNIVVIGSGPAGIAAAVSAAKFDTRVRLVDDNPEAGGQIWRGGGGGDWVAKLRGVERLFEARVIAVDAAARRLTIEQGAGRRMLEYDRLILATGAREVFIPFPGWTQPWIAGVGGLQALVKGGLPVKGKRVAVAGSGPLMLAVASYLRKKGALIISISEQASVASLAGFVREVLRHPGKMLQGAQLQAGLFGIPFRTGCWVERAEPGALWFRSGEKRFREEVDFAAISYGLAPNTELAEALGCEVGTSGVRVDGWQRTSVEGVYCAGEATGIGGLECSLVEGEIAGLGAAGRDARGLAGKKAKAQQFADALNRAFALRPELRTLPCDDTVVCRCEDVTYGQIAKQSQFQPSFRAAKLHTRCGMGPCQARVCGPALDFLFGWKTESVRPPVFPARVGSLIEISEESK